MPSFKPVTALERGLLVLNIVSRRKRAKVPDIHAETGLDKATIIRMLETLVHVGYVARNESDGAYVPTGRTADLSSGLSVHERVADLAGPTISELHRGVGWPCDLAVLDDDAMFLVYSTNERGALRFQRSTGFRAPLLMTSLGRAYIANCEEDEQDRLIARIAKIPGADTAPARRPAKLRAQLNKLRSQGFALSDKQYDERQNFPTLWGFAVPVSDRDTVYGSMGMIMLRSTVSQREAVQKYLRPMQKAAAEIAERLSERR
jgi:IclR family transcriptional regulator, mhp operon transcriptional activator